jgi:hypothetical protein
VGVDAFVLPSQDENIEPTLFSISFLNSHDFDIASLKACADDIGLNYSSNSKKLQLAQEISYKGEVLPSVKSSIVQHLFSNKRKWLAFKLGTYALLPKLADPTILLTKPGQPEWYGPLSEIEQDANWYVRPEFIPHLGTDTDGITRYQTTIRWLCFARLTQNTLSLHWNGFTYSNLIDGDVTQNLQFPYWNHIPRLFAEIEELTGARVQDIDFQKLILHDIWEKYRYDSSFEWIDRRIRGEASGVKLSAHAGMIGDIPVEGVRGLANTIRKELEYELVNKYTTPLPNPDVFDEVILKTLIREYGTHSYEFSLATGDGMKLFRSHCYFGNRSHYPSADSFSHLKIYTSWHTDIEALNFLLGHLNQGYEKSYSPQARLFE